MSNNNDDLVESDEQEDYDEPIDERDVESEDEIAQNDDEDDEPVASPDQQEEQNEHESSDAVDPTNPLDEDSMEAAQNLTQEDVFGEELSDLSEDEDGVRRKKHNDADLDDGEDEQQGDDEDLMEEAEEEEQIIVDTPYVDSDLGRDIHLVKLPTFMKIEPRPFEPRYFMDEVHDDDDEESKARTKLQIENTIRWRHSTNELGESVRESNTRLVRWSDGSLSLHVGKEIFDVSKANMQSDHNHLFVRHQKSMQAQTVFRTKLSFRQHSHDSLAHLKLKFASKAKPAPKVRVISNVNIPTLNSNDMRKKEEQRMRTEERRRNQQLRQRERAAYRNRRISESYLEDREDYDDNEQESLNAIKKNVKKKKLLGGYQADDTSEEEEEEDADDDEDADESNNRKRSSAVTKHRKVASSDEGESNDEPETKRKRVKSDGDDDDEEDEPQSD